MWCTLYMFLLFFQKVNFFLNMNIISRKDLMAIIMKRYITNAHFYILELFFFPGNFSSCQHSVNLLNWMARCLLRTVSPSWRLSISNFLNMLSGYKNTYQMISTSHQSLGCYPMSILFYLSKTKTEWRLTVFLFNPRTRQARQNGSKSVCACNVYKFESSQN